MDLRQKLFELEDKEYKEFSSKLIKTRYPLIGVRIPILKSISKDNKDKSFDFNTAIYFEEIMVEGLLIGYLKDIDLVVNKLRFFIPKIDNWSICDSVCENLKITNKNKEKMWDFITSYKTSNNEFEIRFMIVMMMDYYLEEKYINNIFNILDNIKCDFYYVNMAIAWLLSTSLVKNEKETLEYLDNNNLSDFIINKTISKAKDSYRVNKELKEILKKMKR